MANKKTPHSVSIPPPNKTPRVDPVAAPNASQRSPVWRVRTMDVGGPWCFLGKMDAILSGAFQKRLADLETMSWAAIDGQTGSHFVPTSSFSKVARDRLRELKQDDVEQLYSLRVTARIRVWGIREEHVLKFLWFDPDHEVCPSVKKNT